MSDHFINFVPTDPNWRASKQVAERAVELLKGFLPCASTVEAHFPGKMMFFDPGQNWAGAKCPNCATNIDDWWSEAMQEAWAKDFVNLQVTTPCCGIITSLNDLNFGWPGSGFARFALEVMNPNVRDTTEAQDRALAECVGHPLRKIFVHR